MTINLNVNIKHEILIKVDKQLDDLFSNDKGDLSSEYNDSDKKHVEWAGSDARLLVCVCR
ncbi:MAG: YnbE family lipoprotein [Candidatus Azotimanducaceae bacterium WSBS_2022_MAG_OTU7]